MYRVYRNQGRGLITLGEYSFIGLTIIESFRHTFRKNCKGYKVEIWYTHGQSVDYCVYRNQDQGPLTFRVKSIDTFYNLPSMKKIPLYISQKLQSCKVEHLYTYGQ